MVAEEEAGGFGDDKGGGGRGRARSNAREEPIFASS